MINDNAEKCRGCTIKHLTTALVWVNDTDHAERLKVAYLCGNLAHAANHFVHYSPEIAEEIRQLRLEAINEDLSLNLSIDAIRTSLETLIDEVSTYSPPVIPVVPKNTVTVNSPARSGGCGCRKK